MCWSFVEEGEQIRPGGRGRQFYAVQGRHHFPSSGLRLGVHATFYHTLVDIKCGNVLQHWADIALDGAGALQAHVAGLPRWARALTTVVDYNGKVGRDRAVRLCAALLGVSVRTVYAELPPQNPPLTPGSTPTLGADAYTSTLGETP